jgi:TIR domain/Calcineurin-like phosphoesterase
MREVFISYRRKDSGPYAGWLCDLMRVRLGDDAVFMDEDGIPYGEKFLSVIVERLSACRVFLAVIGPRWLNIRRGLRGRIFQPNDTVRLETLVALNRDIRVIPVLVGGARVPPPNFLPASIAGLAALNAKTISDAGFRQDVAALAEIIAESLFGGSTPDNTVLRLERDRVEHLIKEDLENNRPGGPRFGKLDPDRSKFEENHHSDATAWKKIQAARSRGPKPQPVPKSRGGVEPVLRLLDVWGPVGSDVVKAIEKTGKIVFHAVGSTGNIRAPGDMALVTDRMTQEFRPKERTVKPSFLFHLGDVIYMFGKAKYYYDQFYVPYRQYPAPIFAVAGNHDGMVVPGTGSATLAAFIDNFCAEGFHETAASRGLGRTAQIQPGVYFTLEAPFVRILALYSNILDGPGVISGQDTTSPESNRTQLEFLETALNRVKNERFKGAVIIAVHHDLYSPAGGHGGSPQLLADLDSLSARTGVWPHAVLSGHAHNYQRYTRTIKGMQIPYIVAGGGGYGIAQLRHGTPPARTVPMRLPLNGDDVKLEKYDDQHYGYLRIAVDPKCLRVEFQPTSGTSDDSVILSLKTRRLVLRSMA